MKLCNAHYYATRDPLGTAGDFTTAPEVSQMFGEIIGAALADCWARAGAPANASYAELGPGRGTLAADALRVLRKAGFAGEVHFVETSPTLRRWQVERVPDAHWHDAVDGLPDVPLLLVANEFLDALPVRQWVGNEERHVAIRNDSLAFTLDGMIREDSPARNAVVGVIASHLATHGGAALVIDYGHAQPGLGDTLQAVRRHGYADPLVDPGEADLTAHVDFEAVQETALAARSDVSASVSQSRWLERLGIAQRARVLSTAHPDRAKDFAAAVQRLCDANQMGALFKVMAIHSSEWAIPAGFE